MGEEDAEIVLLLSPHAWGWTGFTAHRSGAVSVVPTRVGVDRPAGLGPGLPHKLSPHAWGWTAPFC